MDTSNKIVLAVGAHPDDVEFVCAGTLALLKQRGWSIHIASMTAGDCGSATLKAGAISRIRRQEGAAAARVLDGTYHCLECQDVFVLYDRATLIKVIALMRQVKPTLVLAPSPQDYFVDHEVTAQLVRTASFVLGIPNIPTPGIKPYDVVPTLYYADPIEGKDMYGQKINPTRYVNVGPVIELKEKMLCCHKSQRDWLLAHHGIDKYVETMKEFVGKRGAECGLKYAEGFRQHLGHGYPQADLLAQELAGWVKSRKSRRLKAGR